MLIGFCWWIYKKHRRGFLIISGITFLFYLSTISFLSDILILSLENQYKPPATISGDVIIMLGGGATLDTPNIGGKGHLSGAAANRLLTCIQLYHKLKAPVVVSAGKVYQTTGIESEIARTILLGIGIPPTKIMVENKSVNTTENARYTKKILDQYHLRRPVLVTSAFHMPRAVKQFRKAGITVIPYPTDYRVNVSAGFEIRKLIPSSEALNQMSIAIKEYVGLMVVKWH
jgi:uncharacterized SAM-binding protein YcdF (DUF218 family)